MMTCKLLQKLENLGKGAKSGWFACTMCRTCFLQ